MNGINILLQGKENYLINKLQESRGLKLRRGLKKLARDENKSDSCSVYFMNMQHKSHCRVRTQMFTVKGHKRK